jgi:HAD superfamily hydrolase (TIGR01509 family)
MKIKLIVFDMDGVLIDACEWHRVALNKSLSHLCGYEISLEQHYSDFNGLPTKMKLRKLLEMGVVEECQFDEIESFKQKFTIDLIEKKASIRQEKIELLNYLKNKEIKIACYTNSIRHTAKLMLYKTGIIDFFDLIVTNQDVDNPKPDPQGYIKIMQHFSVKPEETIIVEDSPKGFEAAYRSQARVFKVRDQEEVNLKLFRGFL